MKMNAIWIKARIEAIETEIGRILQMSPEVRAEMGFDWHLKCLATELNALEAAEKAASFADLAALAESAEMSDVRSPGNPIRSPKRENARDGLTRTEPTPGPLQRGPISLKSEDAMKAIGNGLYARTKATRKTSLPASPRVRFV